MKTKKLLFLLLALSFTGLGLSFTYVKDSAYWKQVASKNIADSICDVQLLPFQEGFNTDSETIDCWTILDLNEDATEWDDGKFTTYAWDFYEGDRSLGYTKWEADHNDWAISPTFTGTGNYKVSFYYKSETDNPFSVLFSNTGSDNVDNFEEILSSSSIKKADKWIEKIIYLENITNDFNIAFAVVDSSENKSFRIDNFKIEQTPLCTEPYDTVITESTTNSITVEWKQYGDVNKWEIVALPYTDDFPDDETTLDIIQVAGTPKETIKNLEAGNLYNVYVRAICDEKNPSQWTLPLLSGTNPINDDCKEAINVPVNNGVDCIDFIQGTMFGATLSSEYSTPSCLFGQPANDVWFTFTATEEKMAISIFDMVGASGFSSLFITVYEGDCNKLKEIFCEQSAPNWAGEDTYSVLDQLEKGKTYYIRILADKANEDLFFKLCIITPEQGIYISPSGKDYSIIELVKEVLIQSDCDLVSNIKYQAGDGGNKNINTFGYFNRGDSDFPFEEGIVLSTNDVKYISGPYKGFEYFKERVPMWSGDPDLNEVIEQIGGIGFGSQKAVAVLEFDFIPVKDSLKFEYIFVSDSYNKGCAVVCQPGGALFAAWLTEIGTGNGQNLALVPSTDLPIALSTIRDSEISGAACESINPEYYGKHYANMQNHPMSAPINYSGSTLPMSSETVVVKPGKKYRIKLAIADFCGFLPDASAVFFNAGSFDLGAADLGIDLRVDQNNALCEFSTYTLNSGLDPNWVDISWYKDDVLINGEKKPTLEINESGEYTVVGRYTAVPSCEVSDTVTIEYYEPIKNIVSKPTKIDYCRNSLEDFIDLTTIENEMFNNVDNRADYQIEYYLTKEERDQRENIINNPKEFPTPKDELVDIYINVHNSSTGCNGDFHFTLNPVEAIVPKNPGDQQACFTYSFPSLPENQYYYTGPGGTGEQYREGEILDKPGEHDIYIYSITGQCYEEILFKLKISAPIIPYELEDVILQCENYILPQLPIGSYYYIESQKGEKIELEAGTEIKLDQKIYIVTETNWQSVICDNESYFEVIYKDCPIPKGISPNGDGLNDFLDLSVHGVTSIKIYNRFGTEVYSHGENYSNEWKGQDNTGKNLPDGVYYYVIITHGKTKTGWIQINKN